MRQYDIIKRVERMGKSVSMIAGQAEPTIIQPSLYKVRGITISTNIVQPLLTSTTNTLLFIVLILADGMCLSIHIYPANRTLLFIFLGSAQISHGALFYGSRRAMDTHLTLPPI